MADESFKYPPGIIPISYWTKRFVESTESFGEFVKAMQQDAVSAARRELQGLDVLAANNAAHKEKVCKCVFAAAYTQNIYEWGGVKICGHCERPIL